MDEAEAGHRPPATTGCGRPHGRAGGDAGAGGAPGGPGLAGAAGEAAAEAGRAGGQRGVPGHDDVRAPEHRGGRAPAAGRGVRAGRELPRHGGNLPGEARAGDPGPHLRDRRQLAQVPATLRRRPGDEGGRPQHRAGVGPGEPHGAPRGGGHPGAGRGVRAGGAGGGTASVGHRLRRPVPAALAGPPGASVRAEPVSAGGRGAGTGGAGVCQLRGAGGGDRKTHRRGEGAGVGTVQRVDVRGVPARRHVRPARGAATRRHSEQLQPFASVVRGGARRGVPRRGPRPPALVGAGWRRNLRGEYARPRRKGRRTDKKNRSTPGAPRRTRASTCSREGTTGSIPARTPASTRRWKDMRPLPRRRG